MKVVIFCGGLGVRMGEATQRIPKPMIPVGNQPDPLAHHEVLRGVGAQATSSSASATRPRSSRSTSSTTTRRCRERLRALGAARRSSCWRATSTTGGSRSSTPGTQRRSASGCLRSRPHLGDDEFFLATYGDGLTDAPLDEMIDELECQRKTGLFLSVRPRLNSHVVRRGRRRRRPVDRADGEPPTSGSTAASSSSGARSSTTSSPGEELVDEPFRAADREGELIAYRYDGFWAPMDTIKDKQDLDALVDSGARALAGRTAPAHAPG